MIMYCNFLQRYLLLDDIILTTTASSRISPPPSPSPAWRGTPPLSLSWPVHVTIRTGMGSAPNPLLWLEELALTVACVRTSLLVTKMLLHCNISHNGSPVASEHTSNGLFNIINDKIYPSSLGMCILQVSYNKMP